MPGSSKEMRLFPYGVYLEGLLAIADLHLGYEDALRERGVELPYEQYPRIKGAIIRLISDFSPDKVIIVGDVKHEFGTALNQEWREVLDLIKTIRGMGVELEVVRGNHDNFLIPILRKEGIEIKDYLVEAGIMFVHGHKPFIPPDNVNLIVMGHEHPAVALRDELGAGHKMKAFLKAKFMDRELLVLPALSPLAPGTDVLQSYGNFLSPALRSIDPSEITVLVADDELWLVEELGPLNLVRKAAGVI